LLEREREREREEKKKKKKREITIVHDDIGTFIAGSVPPIKPMFSVSLPPYKAEPSQPSSSTDPSTTD